MATTVVSYKDVAVTVSFGKLCLSPGDRLTPVFWSNRTGRSSSASSKCVAQRYSKVDPSRSGTGQGRLHFLFFSGYENPQSTENLT
jgi:hypothetical protein